MDHRGFATLPPDVQDEIRRKQREKKLAKQQEALSATAASRAAPAVAAGKPEAKEYPTRIGMDEYFDTCPYGLFRDPNFAPTEANLESLMSLLRKEEKTGAHRLNLCNYFQFVGPAETVWDPVFNAKLAYEGFFTITTGRPPKSEPLPELQPFYGVVTWDNFDKSKHVRKTLSRLRREGRDYRLSVTSSSTSWDLLDSYQLKHHGQNWLTKRYFEMMMLASKDPSVNFRGHCVELCTGEGEQRPVAGEIGFSIGKVYTSLSGWTGDRTAEGLGTIQLVLLGRWLQQRGYAFWSLGHCYSPQMEYKRQLGHRIYPRYDFIDLLSEHRGAFRLPSGAEQPGLRDGDACSSKSLLDVDCGGEDLGTAPS